MARTITLRYPAVCADPDCGAELPAGTRARWYGRGRVYGFDCHGKPTGGGRRERTAYERGDRSPGAVASHFDPRGLYTPDGRLVGVSGRCEDAPCCGCCP